MLDGDLNLLRSEYAPSKRSVRIRVPLADRKRAADAISDLDCVGSCIERDQMLLVTGDDVNGNRVLAALLEHDVHILEFAEDEPNLEDIFMRSTAGKVT